MTRLKRRDCLLLALMLAVSVVAWSGHATVHAKAGADQCLMCASHSDPNSTVHAQVATPEAGSERTTPPAFPATVEIHTRPVFTWQTRAPPLTS